MVVLFNDQSRNVRSITPYYVSFELLKPAPPPLAAFGSHITDELDFLAGSVQLSAMRGASVPGHLHHYSRATRLAFNH